MSGVIHWSYMEDGAWKFNHSTLADASPSEGAAPEVRFKSQRWWPSKVWTFTFTEDNP